VFWDKRLQGVENKERELEKEGKERPKRRQVAENKGKLQSHVGAEKVCGTECERQEW
jgi:hypothetical protein